MKTIAILILSILSCAPKTTTKTTSNMKTETKSIYQFKVENINGKTFDFSTLKGKKIMIVNTASKCGLTPQYKGLESLYKKYQTKNFIIIGFPANNFMGQEPGSDKDIASFCELNYGVSFPMMSKISVKGKEIHPIYKYLTSGDLNGLKDNGVAWNFQKYLINEEGFLEMVIGPKTSPTDESIVQWIEG